MQQGPAVPVGVGHETLPRRSSLPWPFWAALIAVLVGWFPSDTLSTTVGALRLHFHFFDLASLIARPSRLMTGVNRGDALTVPFGIVCLAALAAPFAPRFSSRPVARLGPCVPLILMLLCGVALYAATRGDSFQAAADAGRVAHALTRLGNSLASRASAVAARHVQIGAGTWLSLVGAIYLTHRAWRG